MRKVTLLMHTSLDGFLAGPNGEMDWIKFDDDLWEYIGKITEEADTAIYGRITYQMMESYWPTAAESPTASKHDIKHAHWVNNALKIVFSKTLEKTDWQHTKIMGDHIGEQIANLKKEPGKNLLLIGSASIAHAFMQLDLIDEYWINTNPVILGAGTPLFTNLSNRANLQLVEAKTFDCKVVGLHYNREHS